MIQAHRFWTALGTFAAWLVTSFAAFMVFPVRLSSTSNIEQFVIGATLPLVAVVCGIVSLLPKSLAKNSTASHWVVAGSLLLVAFLLAFSCYIVLQIRWTCPYTEGTRLIVGEISVDSCEVFLKEIAGMTESVFPRAILHFRFVLLSACYIVSWMFFAAMLMCLGNATTIRQRTSRKQR